MVFNSFMAIWEVKLWKIWYSKATIFGKGGTFPNFTSFFNYFLTFLFNFSWFSLDLVFCGLDTRKGPGYATKSQGKQTCWKYSTNDNQSISYIFAG